MQWPKRKNSAPPRSSFSAPVLSPAPPVIPAWVSHTQVPDNPPSVHYSATPSPSASLIFDPWKRFHYSNPQTTLPKEGAVYCDQRRESTARTSRRPGTVPRASSVHQGMTLVSALAIAACILAFVVTAKKLAITESNTEKATERFMVPVTNVTTSRRHHPSRSGSAGGLDDRARIGAPAEGAKRRTYSAGAATEEITQRSSASGQQSSSESIGQADLSSASTHTDTEK